MRPPLLATLLLLPLAILEVTQRRAYQEGFPWALFALLWLLAVAFVRLLPPVLGRQAGVSRLRLGLAVAGLVLLASAWGAIVVDQLPCFLGVPNCD
jgi:hypothetical protein